MKSLHTNIASIGLLFALVTPVCAKVPVEVSMPSKAKPGAKVNIAVKTEANLKCKIEAQDAGFTQSLNLLDQTSSKNGKAKWKFQIPKDYKADKMPVIITVEKDGEQDKTVKSIEILK